MGIIHLKHLKSLQTKILIIFFLAACILSLQAYAETDRFQRTKQSLPEYFAISTDKKFSTLFDEAMEIMNSDMSKVVMNGDPEHDFAAIMIPHHQGAIHMAKILLLYGKDSEIRSLGLRIITTQQNEIKIMQSLLEGLKPGKTETSKLFSGFMQSAHAAMYKEMEKAEKIEDPDHDFAAMMIPHHQGAVDMAKALITYGKDPRLRKLAQEIIAEQRFEIQLMQAWLKRSQATDISTHDRVYTADQLSNTVSVINPATNTLIGQIRLGNVRPDILSTLYKGELNVHGLGFSPDHKTLIAVSTGSNAVAFIDTETNTVKKTIYEGRSPYEGVFTPDGSELWIAVRGESYIAVLNPKTFNITHRIITTTGPGMVIFNPNGKYAYVCNSFNPVFEVIDTAQYKVIKKIEVASPFSPYLVMTPDSKEIWLTHKDAGKITRIDAEKLKVISVFDTGFITNRVHFSETPKGVFAYVTVGGENAVKVYTYEAVPKLAVTIPVGAFPNGIYPSDDGSRMYVGLENSDAVEVIDTAANKVITRIPVGQSPQAVVYLSNAVEGEGTANLKPRALTLEVINVSLKAQADDAKGFVVVRSMGLVDSFEVSVSELKPNTVYKVYIEKQDIPAALLETNEKGYAAVTSMGPVRKSISSISPDEITPSRIFIMEGNAIPDLAKAVLISVQ